MPPHPDASPSALRPPRLVTALLRQVGAGEAALGDLEEAFHDDVDRYGRRRAAWRYRVEGLGSLPHFILQTLLWSPPMLRNYLTVAVRNLTRHKVYSGINIAGLAVSMALCLVLLLFLYDQRTYDRFHDGAERIHLVYSDYKASINNDSHLYGTAPASLVEVLRASYPEVEAAVRMTRLAGLVVPEDAEGRPSGVQVRGLYAEPAFFEVFDFDLQQGHPETALTEPYTIVLDEATARNLFGEAEPVGRSLRVDGVGTFRVTGVFAPRRHKSVIPTTAVASFATRLASPEVRARMAEDWQNTVRNHFAFVKLAPGADPAAFEAQLQDLIPWQFPGTEAAYLAGLHLRPLTKMTLGDAMDNAISFILSWEIAYFLAALALVIMLTACLNYVNLSVARALKRSKEVGIRKVVGAHRGQVARQFLSEAVLMAGLALLIACGLLVWLVPAFNSLLPIQFTGSEIRVRPDDPGFYLLLLGFAAVIGVLAGAYPALVLSRFTPSRILSGGSRRGGGSRVRKGLLVVQFTASLLFIVTAAVLVQQFRHVANADYGFNEEHILNVDLQDVEYATFRQEMRTHPAVVEVSGMSILPGEGSRSDVWMQSAQHPDRLKGYTVSIDERTLDNLDIDLLAGRTFDPAFGTDADQAVLLNETAVRVLGLGTPAEAVGQTVTFFGEFERTVVGVVEDYRFFSALAAVDPLALDYDLANIQHANIRFRPDGVEGLLAHLEATWAEMNTIRPLSYGFFDVQLQEAIELVVFREAMELVGFGAMFAVFIACLGLLGLAAYSIEVRLKEVSIRKVLGASMSRIVLLLSKDFLVLIGVAVVVGTPLAWLVNEQWLQNIGNRIALTPWVFVAAIGTLVGLALLMVGSQAARAARINPAELLRRE